MKYLSLFFALLSCLVLWGGPRVTGNGGNVITCVNAADSSKRHELLDFFEARVLLRRELKLEAELKSEILLESLLERIGEKSPELAKQYLLWVANFYSEAQFISGVTLTPINDSFPAAVPANCAIEQTIVQKIPQYPGDQRYLINQDIWDQLDEANKAGLILHEVIYRGLIENSWEEVHSVTVRHLVGYVASDTLESLSEIEWTQLLRDLQALPAEGQGAKELISKRWSYDKISPTGIRGTFELSFTDRETMHFSNTCRFSEQGLGPDLTATVTVRVRMTDSTVDMLEDQTNTVNGHGRTCTVVSRRSPAPVRYTFLSDGRLVMMGHTLVPTALPMKHGHPR